MGCRSIPSSYLKRILISIVKVLSKSISLRTVKGYSISKYQLVLEL